jgi:hypothetical protein
MRMIMPLGAKSGLKVACGSGFSWFGSGGERWRIATVTLAFGCGWVGGFGGTASFSSGGLEGLL